MLELTREFSQQVALRVITVSEASAYIGAQSSAINGMLMRCESPGKHEIQLEELVILNREKAGTRLRKWRSILKRIGVPQSVLTNAVSRAHIDDLLPRISSLKDEQIVNTLAHLILATLPMAERVLSDDFSSADRSRLRELTQNGRSNAVFELSNVLNRLCGERARKELL